MTQKLRSTKSKARPGSPTNASDAVDDIQLGPDASSEDILDEGLEETFPASDPVSVQRTYRRKLRAAPRRKPPALRFDLPSLPYEEDALAPVISAETLRLHHGKHHRKYVDNVNRLLEQHPTAGETLADVVRGASGGLFNNAAQAWNHDFYWHSLSPKGGRPAGALLRQLEKDFGSYESFVEAFATAGNNQFGSGWAWLVQKAGKLEVMATANADTPMARGTRCLLTIDVWEHAYYIDYRNQRARYLAALIGQRMNWSFAERNLQARSAR